MSEVVLAHLSDVHFGAQSEGSAQSLVDDVRRVGANATVVTGDLTTRARRHEFDAAVEMVTALPGPRLVVLGNHDIPLHDPVRRLLDPYGAFLAAFGGPLDPLLDLSGVRILGLASVPRWRWKAGRVSRRQIALVDAVLGTAPAGCLKVLAMHHPPNAQGAARVAGRRALLASLAANDVDLVLAGHEHHAAVRPIYPPEAGRGLGLEVIAGTGASSRLGRGRGRSWTVIRVSDSDVTISERRDTMTGWATFAETRYSRLPGVAG